MEKFDRPPLGRKPEAIPEQSTISFSSPIATEAKRGITGRNTFVKLSPPEYQLLWLLHSYWGKEFTREEMQKFVTKHNGSEVRSFDVLLHKAAKKLREATGGEVIISGHATGGTNRRMVLNPDFKHERHE